MEVFIVVSNDLLYFCGICCNVSFFTSYWACLNHLFLVNLSSQLWTFLSFTRTNFSLLSSFVLFFVCFNFILLHSDLILFFLLFHSGIRTSFIEPLRPSSFSWTVLFPGNVQSGGQQWDPLFGQWGHLCRWWRACSCVGGYHLRRDAPQGSWLHPTHVASSSSLPCICGKHGQPSGWVSQFCHLWPPHQQPFCQLRRWLSWSQRAASHGSS